MKPGVKRSETPGSPTKKLPEPAARAIAVSIYKTSVVMISLSAATRASVIPRLRVPGVALRFTPGFMLSAASPAGRSFHLGPYCIGNFLALNAALFT
jgi:hypothetical protein